MNRYFSLASADLVVPNQEAWRLLWDFQTLKELVGTLPGNTPYVKVDFMLAVPLTTGQAPEQGFSRCQRDNESSQAW
jgi:hypothetical protein